MQEIIINTSALHLPHELAERISAEQVVIREVSEGFLLIPMHKKSEKLRGVLKGTSFSSERYFEQKWLDKELEG